MAKVEQCPKRWTIVFTESAVSAVGKGLYSDLYAGLRVLSVLNTKILAGATTFM